MMAKPERGSSGGGGGGRRGGGGSRHAAGAQRFAAAKWQASLNQPAANAALLKQHEKPTVAKVGPDLNMDLGQARDLAFWQGETADALLACLSTVHLPALVHDGDPSALVALAQKASAQQCSLGAHVGFPTPASAGYEAPPTLDKETLTHWFRVQLGALQTLLKPYQLGIEQVRPHGALYHSLMQGQVLVAEALMDAMTQVDPWLKLVAPPRPQLKSMAAERNLLFAGELLVGQSYTRHYTLASPALAEPLSQAACLAQAQGVVSTQSLLSREGQPLPFEVATLHLTPPRGVAGAPCPLALAQTLIEALGKPVAVALQGAQQSGWLQGFDERQELAPDRMPAHAYYE